MSVSPGFARLGTARWWSTIESEINAGCLKDRQTSRRLTPQTAAGPLKLPSAGQGIRPLEELQ